MQVMEHGIGTYTFARTIWRFLSSCNYDINDYIISSKFYDLLLWWSKFGKLVSLERIWETTVWNNKETNRHEASLL